MSSSLRKKRKKSHDANMDMDKQLCRRSTRIKNSQCSSVTEVIDSKCIGNARKNQHVELRRSIRLRSTCEASGDQKCASSNSKRKQECEDKLIGKGGEKDGNQKITTRSRNGAKNHNRSSMQKVLFEALESALPSQPQDFELPPDWIKSRPLRIPSYRQITKNRYPPGLRPSQLFPHDPAPPCSCRRDNGGCTENCQNFMLLMECSPETCPCCEKVPCRENKGVTLRLLTKEKKKNIRHHQQKNFGENSSMKVRYCGNTVIQRADYPPVEIFDTVICGFGLKSPQEIPPYTIIAEYTGDVITEDECMNRMRKYKKTDAFYFASLGKGLILDACKMGSIARFANHNCSPNCALQKWCVNGEPRVVLVSLDEAIPAETELCYNYQYCQDGLDVEIVRRQPCHCGSAICAGTIGGKVKECLPSTSKKWIEKVKGVLMSISGAKVDTLGTACPEKLNINRKLHLQAYQSSNKLNTNNSGQHTDKKPRRYTLQQIFDLYDISNIPVDEDDDHSSEVEKKKILQSLEYTTLDEVVQNIQVWQNAFPNWNYVPSLLDPDKIFMCDRGHLRSMVNEFPYDGVKLFSTDWAEKSIKAAGRAELSIERILSRQFSHSSFTTSQLGSENFQGLHAASPCMSPTKNDSNEASDQFRNSVCQPDSALVERMDCIWSFDWDDFIIIIEEMIHAVPVTCCDGYHVLSSYQRCSEWAFCYLKVYTSPLICHDTKLNKTKCGMQGGCNFESYVKVLPSNYAALWKSIAFLGCLYGLPDISPLFLIIASNLEDRVTLYENRLHWKGVNDTKVDKNWLVERCLPPENDNVKHASASVVNPAALHCFCLMTDSDAEFSEFVMCDSCNKWYHMQCCNKFQPHTKVSEKACSSLSIAKKRALPNIVDESSRFLCPICELHENIDMPSYSKHWSLEWHNQCATAFPSFLKKRSKVAVGVHDNCVRSKKNECKDMVVSETESLDIINKDEPQCHTNPFHINQSYKAISLKYLEKVINSEGVHCPLVNTPITDNLKVMWENIAIWQHEAKSFVERLCDFEGVSLDYDGISCDVLSDYTSQVALADEELQKAIQLYLDLRLLCTVPNEVATLRLIVWGITIQSLFSAQDLSFHQDYKQSLCIINRIRIFRRLPVVSSSRIISLTQLKTRIGYGKAISKHDTVKTNDIGNYYRNLVVLMSRLYDDILSILNEALLCRDHSSAAVLLERMHKAVHCKHLSIDVTDEYSYARLATFARVQVSEANENSSEKPRHDTTTSALVPCKNFLGNEVDSSSHVTQLQELYCTSSNPEESYCWCGGPQSGQMICCEKCDIWFHCACVGLSSKKLLKSLADVPYFCIVCAESNNSQYEYAWKSKHISGTFTRG